MIKCMNQTLLLSKQSISLIVKFCKNMTLNMSFKIYSIECMFQITYTSIVNTFANGPTNVMSWDKLKLMKQPSPKSITI